MRTKEELAAQLRGLPRETLELLTEVLEEMDAAPEGERHEALLAGLHGLVERQDGSDEGLRAMLAEWRAETGPAPIGEAPEEAVALGEA